jgi:hypothetical protein
MILTTVNLKKYFSIKNKYIIIFSKKIKLNPMMQKRKVGEKLI